MIEEDSCWRHRLTWNLPPVGLTNLWKVKMQACATFDCYKRSFSRIVENHATFSWDWLTKPSRVSIPHGVEWVWYHHVCGRRLVAYDWPSFWVRRPLVSHLRRASGRFHCRVLCKSVKELCNDDISHAEDHSLCHKRHVIQLTARLTKLALQSTVLHAESVIADIKNWCKATSVPHVPFIQAFSRSFHLFKDLPAIKHSWMSWST